MLYNTLILPHLNYCLIIWGINTSRILLLQKKAMRIISNSWYRAHTEPIFKGLNILNINDLYRLMVLKFYFKLENKLLPVYFNTFIPKMPQIKHQYARNTFRCELIAITNFISNTSDYDGIIDKVQTHSLHGYSLYIKNKLMSKYENECNIINCYSCTHYIDLYPPANG